jgi:adenine deaminase
MTKRQPWHECAKDLVDVAMGRKAATMVIRNGRWLNVHSGEIIPHTDVAIYQSRIAYVGEDAGYTIGPETVVVEGNGRYLIPGLCDGHMHVESGMVTVTEFARAVIPHGTTSMFIDPHEIANVLGLPGVRLMHDEAQTLPVNVYVQMPSCVPSAPGLETPGASIGPAEVAEAMTWPGIIGLGEMMNFPGVFLNDDKMHAEMAETMKAGKVIGGHYASADLGRPFHGYIAGGPADDHEGTRLEDAIARVRRGMKAMLRLGSAWYDVASQVKAITELGLDSRNFILCTDDSHSGTLVHEGHMNRVVRHAIAQGLKPITAIQMATLNTAEHFGVAKDVGSITPGRYADIILSSDLADLPIELVIAAGEVVAENGRLTADLPPYDYPDFAKNSIKLGKELTAVDFNIPASQSSIVNRQLSIVTRVIGVVENQAPTRALTRELPIQDGLVVGDPAQDVCQIALVERHQATGGVTNGFVHGFGFNAPLRRRHHRRPRQPPPDRRRHRQGEHGPGRQSPGRSRRRRGRLQGWARNRPGGIAHRWPDVRRTGGNRGREGGPHGGGDGRMRLRPEQRLHAAQPAGPRRHPGTAHLRPGHRGRDEVRGGGFVCGVTTYLQQFACCKPYRRVILLSHHDSIVCVH